MLPLDATASGAITLETPSGMIFISRRYIKFSIRDLNHIERFEGSLFIHAYFWASHLALSLLMPWGPHGRHVDMLWLMLIDITETFFSTFFQHTSMIGNTTTHLKDDPI
jgi:hypothetical protein